MAGRSTSSTASARPSGPRSPLLIEDIPERGCGVVWVVQAGRGMVRSLCCGRAAEGWTLERQSADCAPLAEDAAERHRPQDREAPRADRDPGAEAGRHRTAAEAGRAQEARKALGRRVEATAPAPPSRTPGYRVTVPVKVSALPASRLEHRCHLAPTAESLKAAEALHDLPIAALFQARLCRSEGDRQVATGAAEDPVHRPERGLLRPIDEAPPGAEG
jgi:hypothetical protein